MTTRQLVFTAGAVGLTVSVAILTLLGFGVSGVLTIRNVDLIYLLWPSSLMLTTGLRTTVPCIALTIVSVFANCLTYLVIAVLLRAILRSILNLIGRGSTE